MTPYKLSWAEAQGKGTIESRMIATRWGVQTGLLGSSITVFGVEFVGLDFVGLEGEGQPIALWGVPATIGNPAITVPIVTIAHFFTLIIKTPV